MFANQMKQLVIQHILAKMKNTCIIIIQALAETRNERHFLLSSFLMYIC